MFVVRALLIPENKKTLLPVISFLNGFVSIRNSSEGKLRKFSR